MMFSVVCAPYCRTSVIQPMQLDMDGNMREMTTKDLHRLTHNPVIQPEGPAASDSDDET